MQRYLFAIDHVSIFVGKLFGWSILLLTAVVCYEVFMRYVMNTPTIWAYDMGYILYGTLFMMAGSYALATQSHVRADVITRLLSVRKQALIEVVLYPIFFFPAVLALTFYGYTFMDASLLIGERSPYSPHGPLLWPFKALIPLSGFFLFFQGVAEFTRAIVALKTGQRLSRISDVKELGDEILEQNKAEVVGADK